MELKPRSSSFLNGMIFAVSYFSALPLSLKSFEADDRFYRGVIYGLPITGALLAIFTIVIFFILNLFFPSLYSGFLSALLYLFLYGFLHLEAVADTIDGWYASLSNKDVYSVMKEPQIGAMGAIGAFCIVLLKVAAITYLFYLGGFLVIFAAFVLSRFSLYFILELELHKQSSFLISMQKAKQKCYFLEVFLIFLKWIVFAIINKISKKIGFINGDIAGFCIELTELILLNMGLLLIL